MMLTVQSLRWLSTLTLPGLEHHFASVVGAGHALRRYQRQHNQQRIKGMGAAKRWLDVG